MIVKVQSSKDPSVLYEVDTETGECECPQYQRRLKGQNAQRPREEWTYCKHILHAKEILAGEK